MKSMGSLQDKQGVGLISTKEEWYQKAIRDAKGDKSQ
jgi:hypothetical protein